MNSGNKKLASSLPVVFREVDAWPLITAGLYYSGELLYQWVPGQALSHDVFSILTAAALGALTLEPRAK